MIYESSYPYMAPIQGCRVLPVIPISNTLLCITRYAIKDPHVNISLHGISKLKAIYNFLQSHQQPPALGQRGHKKHKPTGYTRDSYHSHIILAPTLFYTIPVYQLHQHPIGLHYRIRAILLLDTHGAHYNVRSRILKSSDETPHGSKPLR